MSFERFKSIVDRIGKYVYIVDLFDWGEPLLNKDIYAIIRYAEQKHLCTNIHTNLNSKLSEENVEQIVSSGLSYLSVSLDGADQEVYSIYRRKGNLELALENARRVIAFRKKTGSQKPHMTWQFLVFPHNRHQIERAKKMAFEIGFDRFRATVGIMSGGLSNVKTSQDGISAMKDLAETACDWLWTTATIHWDGGVAPCCLEFKEEDDFGSIAHTDFKSVWNNDKFKYARSLFGRRIREHEKVLCSQCYKVRSL